MTPGASFFVAECFGSFGLKSGLSVEVLVGSSTYLSASSSMSVLGSAGSVGSATFWIASCAFSACFACARSFSTSMIGVSGSSKTPRRSFWNSLILPIISDSCFRKLPSGILNPAACP